MKRFGFATCLAMLAIAASVKAQDFTLGFECPGNQEQPNGGDFSRDIAATVQGPGDIQGWSISVGGNGLSIDAITVDGTVGADVDDGGLEDGGFAKSETTSGPGNEGAVSAIVLSFTLPIVLQALEPARIAILSVSGVYPGANGESATVGVDYIDGRQGAGQPVNNNLTVGGATVKPVFDNCSFTLTNIEAPPICPQVDGEGNALGGVQIYLTPDGFLAQQAQLAGVVEGSDGGEGPAQSEIGTGESGVYAVISSNLVAGVQGWSLSLAYTEGEGTSVGMPTVTGTAGGDVDDGGLEDGGFSKTEKVDPTLGDQGTGMVSAVVCSFTLPITLDPSGAASALLIPVTGAEGSSLSFSWRDGLRGSGQPVGNVATVDGATVGFLCQQNHEFTFVTREFAVQHGESNGDGRVDLADPIWIVNELFRDGPPSPCMAASDANGDNMVDLSDAMYIVAYLFLAGPAPSGVLGGGECEILSPDSGLPCESPSTSCSS